MDGHVKGTTPDGSAYRLPAPSYDARLTEVGRGSPMGELLRRYWHPVGMAADAGATPRMVKVLGEELILFRSGDGKPGLVYPRCAHRGASLFYGKVEQQGIRCCYHGWLFDAQGHCLEQPCEPDGGRNRDRVRQPWYPLEERYGLIFAYLGPPERQPAMPLLEPLEVLGPGEFVEADDSSIGGGGPPIIPCNWLQHFENVMDPLHVPILHAAFSGGQFVPQMAVMPKVKFDYSPRGVKSVQVRTLEGGRTFTRITEAALPTLRVVPSPRVGRYGMVESIGWTLPIDDTTFRIYVAGRVTEKGELSRMRSTFNGKMWVDMTPQEHQQYPGDYEAQVGQGAITFHSEEHLASSDQGVSMLRILLRKQLDAIARGEDPIGVAREGADPTIRFEAGQYLD